MMKTLLATILVAVSLIANGQVTKNQVKVLNAQRGEPAFELEKGVAVYSYEPEGGWYKIRKEAFVKPGQLSEEKYLAPETELRSKDGKVIGRTLEEVKVKEAVQEESFRGEGDYRVILEGYLFKTAFEDESAPEEWVSRLLEIKNRTQQQEGFQELFRQYNFEEREFEEFTAYAMREEGKNLGEKDFRLIVIFRGETPYAVMTNDHSNITAPKVKSEWSQEPFHIWYFFKPTSSQAELIQDEILYTYLAL